MEFYDVENINIFKNLLKKSAVIEFDKYWTRSLDGLHTWNILPHVGDPNIKIENTYLNRKAERMYFQLSFKQNFLNSFRKYIKKSDTDQCRFCKKHVETVNHIFGECDSLSYDELRPACLRKGIQFEMKGILTDLKVKLEVEKFISKNF